MHRDSGDKALIIREAVTNDDHTLGCDFVFADRDFNAEFFCEDEGKFLEVFTEGFHLSREPQCSSRMIDRIDEPTVKL
jgi:hypothetical protein